MYTRRSKRSSSSEEYKQEINLQITASTPLSICPQSRYYDSPIYPNVSLARKYIKQTPVGSRTFDKLGTGQQNVPSSSEKGMVNVLSS